MIDLCEKNSHDNPRLADGTAMGGSLFRLTSGRYAGFYFLGRHHTCGLLCAVLFPSTRELTWTPRASAPLPNEALRGEMRLMLWDRHGLPHPACRALPKHRIIQTGGSLLSIPRPPGSTLQCLKITADPARAYRAPNPRVYTSKKQISSGP